MDGLMDAVVKGELIRRLASLANAIAVVFVT
jgi:hypothetical protein